MKRGKSTHEERVHLHHRKEKKYIIFIILSIKWGKLRKKIVFLHL